MPIPPGDTIKDFIDELGMSQKELAKRMGLSEKHLSHIISGMTPISMDVAEKLQTCLGVKARFWINLENDYREALYRSIPPTITDDEKAIAQQIPYSEICKMGKLEPTKKIDSKVINLREFFGVINLTTISDINVAYRKANICNENKYALLAWIRIAEINAQSLKTESYSRRKLEKAVPEFRRLTLEDPEVFYSKLVDLCANSGIALVVSNHIKGTGVNGVTFLNSKRNKVIIQLSVRGKYADKFWFTFFHEISHILMDESSSFDYIDCDEEVEKKVDAMAADLLIPNDRYREFLRKHRYDDILEIRRFANDVGIHPCIVIGRLKYEERIPYTFFTKDAPKFVIQ